MEGNIFGSILYGMISGFTSLLPVSALAHQELFAYLFGYASAVPFVNLMTYLGALAALILSCGRRLNHMQQELRLASQPKRRRKRTPDMQAVLEFRLVLLGLIPMILALLLYKKAGEVFQGLPMLCFLLIVNGILVYLPQYMTVSNRDSRGLSRLDGVIMGLCAGLSVIPGLSGMTGVLLSARAKGCRSAYAVELAFLYAIVMLLGAVLLCFFAFLGSGGLGMTMILSGILAGIASFGGALAAVYLMRYLAVNVEFHSFSYYCWGLAVFSFLYYLIT